MGPSLLLCVSLKKAIFKSTPQWKKYNIPEAVKVNTHTVSILAQREGELMAHLGMLKHTHCAAAVHGSLSLLTFITYVCGRRSHLRTREVLWVHVCVCVFRERENLEEGRRSQIVFLWCLSHAVSPYQPGSLAKARDPCQAVLDNWMWPECSWETEGDLRKVGWIRRTSPVCLSQTRIRPTRACTCAHTYTQLYARLWYPIKLESHWPIYLEMAKTHQRQNYPKTPVFNRQFQLFHKENTQISTICLMCAQCGKKITAITASCSFCASVCTCVCIYNMRV